MVVDTEGFELIRDKYWWSPRFKKQIHRDSYIAVARFPEMYFEDYYSFMSDRGFTRYEAARIRDEYERGELEEREAMFKIDTKRATYLRVAGRRERILYYSIIEKLKFLKVYLTFSIETGGGHEPFYAEVTCDTTFPAGTPEAETNNMIRRVINGVLKLFFIIFDWNKIVYKGDPDALWRLLYYLRDYANPVYEEGAPPRIGMDNFLTIPTIMERIRSRAPDEFITRESIIAIGVEYESVAEPVPEYPRIHCFIEKTRKGRFSDERDIILAPTTRLWMDKLLGMVVSPETAV